MNISRPVGKSSVITSLDVVLLPNYIGPNTVLVQRASMDDEQVWAAIDTQRRRVADLLSRLTDDQWSQPSLCRGWTVRDVGAHLTLQQVPIADALRVAVRHPRLVLDVNRMIHETAVMRAATISTEEIVAGIR